MARGDEPRWIARGEQAMLDEEAAWADLWDEEDRIARVAAKTFGPATLPCLCGRDWPHRHVEQQFVEAVSDEFVTETADATMMDEDWERDFWDSFSYYNSPFGD